MYRGTTPTIVFHINSDVDLDNMKQIWATFESTTCEITKDISELTVDNDKKTVTVELSQEETLKFSDHNIKVQLRFLTKGNKAFASTIKQIKNNNVLKSGVIYGEE